MLRYLYITLGCLLFAGWSGVCFAGTTDDDAVHLSFGVYQSDKASEMYRKFNPVIQALQHNLELALNRPVVIELKILKTYEAGQDALVAGEVDFARFGPVSYILAKNRNPDVKLLAMENKKGKKRFKGVIITRQDSPIQTLTDFAGRSFAFGNEQSTIGRYLAQMELARTGVFSHDLTGFEYLGRHDKVAKAVAVGDFDGGALKESSFKKANQDGVLRVVASFDNVTKPWVARSGIDPVVYSSLQQVLLSLDDKQALKNLKVDGFFPAADSEYDIIRESMLEAENFVKPPPTAGIS